MHKLLSEALLLYCCFFQLEFIFLKNKLLKLYQHYFFSDRKTQCDTNLTFITSFCVIFNALKDKTNHMHVENSGLIVFHAVVYYILKKNELLKINKKNC